jgi:hypothetical protein
MSYLNDAQLAQLLQGVNPKRVHRLDGMSHMEAYDIRAHLNRVFGFARWSADVVSMELLYERFHENKRKQPAVSVGYRAGLRLTVHAPDGGVLATYTEHAAGSASSFPVSKQADAHDMAIKTSESQALKRAATNLGDQFGLSLYNNGNVNPIVLGTLVQNPAQSAPVDADAPEVKPAEEPSEPELSRDFLAEMTAATTPEEKNAIWSQAKEAGAPIEFLDALREAGMAVAA